MCPTIFASCLAAGILCFAAQDTPPTPFEFSDFSSHGNLKIAGAAHYSGKALRLTDAKEQQAGAVWYTTKEPVTSGFDTTFQFRLTKQGGLGHGADGLAFVLQNSGASTVAGRG